jgi:hypothetical protein
LGVGEGGAADASEEVDGQVEQVAKAEPRWP